MKGLFSVIIVFESVRELGERPLLRACRGAEQVQRKHVHTLRAQLEAMAGMDRTHQRSSVQSRLL